MLSRRFLLAAGAASLAGCSTSALQLPTSTFAFRGPAPSGTLDVVNAARASGGRGPMRIDRAAQRAAERHAKAMARAGRMAHELPGGPKFQPRMQRDRVPLPAAENVAVGQRDVARAVTAWMNSPGHRRNMLDKRFDGVGVASAKGGDGRLYWAMVLVK